LNDFVPDTTTLLLLTPLALVWLTGAAAFVAWLHARRGVRTPYTRKIFHFIVITAAAAVHIVWGLPGVATYGAVASVVVLATVLRGDGFAFYEALARPSDAPRRTLFILVPLVTTAAGGVLASVLFPAWAHIGYLAVAWGDAVGEPVGTRWGRHRYSVPSLAGVPATRTLEGSTAVAVTTAIAVFAALLATGAVGGAGVFGAAAAIAPATAAGVAVAVGLATAAVEAISHHGLDNFTIQLAAAGLTALLLG
jgi:phytol kinase